jgi:hypothetical protein
MTRRTVPSRLLRNIETGAGSSCLHGSDMPAFDYRQATELRDALARHSVRYLFIGKSAAILLGFPDTTQDADLFVDKSAENGRALANALLDLGFALTHEHQRDLEHGKDFVQLKNGPFDVDIVFAPDGIERFEEAWKRRVDVEGFPVCSIDDVIGSKEAANRVKDRESLPRLRAFRDWLRSKGRYR